MRSLVRLLCVAALGVCAVVFAQDAGQSELLKTADEMIRVTARLRGLEPKGPIARGVKSREEIAQYLNEQVRKNFSDGELELEGKMLKTLGLIPSPMDYRDFVLKLYTEQVGGFYDPEQKTFFIASWLPPAEQKPTMVHELGHALQDQHFNVKKIIDESRKLRNDDLTLARQALLEGDGMVVMLNYLLEPAKRDFSQLPDLAFIMRTQMSSMQTQYAVFRAAPAYIQEMVLFPYGYGAAFLQKIWQQNPSWEAINRIYSDLPSSTEQIIHPEKYYSAELRDEPVQVDAEVLAAKLGAGWKAVYRNVLGEFGVNLLLSLHVSEERARRSAAGWDGDQVLLLENAAGKHAVLVDTVWDSAAEADEFFSALQVWFKQRFASGVRTNETAAGFSVTQDKEVHSLRQDGTSVRFVVGLPESDAPRIEALWSR